MIRLFSIITTIFLFLIGCSANKVSEEQAVRITENFIVHQGYTDAKIEIDTSLIVPDFREIHMSKSEILKLRFNTLEPNAVFKTKRMGRWTFGFRNTVDSSRYRVVKLRGDGKKIWIDHQDVQEY